MLHRLCGPLQADLRFRNLVSFFSGTDARLQLNENFQKKFSQTKKIQDVFFSLQNWDAQHGNHSCRSGCKGCCGYGKQLDRSRRSNTKNHRVERGYSPTQHIHIITFPFYKLICILQTKSIFKTKMLHRLCGPLQADRRFRNFGSSPQGFLIFIQNWDAQHGNHSYCCGGQGRSRNGQQPDS